MGKLKPDLSYLENQIKLVSLNTYDLFTDEEFAMYMRIIEFAKQISKLNKKTDMEARVLLIEQKRELIREFNDLVKQHDGTPRTVRLSFILDSRLYDGPLPQGVTWWTLKYSRRIAEFCSEESQKMGLNTNDVTFDKIIFKWKSPQILRQIVVDGFTMPILNEDGTVTTKMYHVVNASAGQLRTDKVQCLSDDIWEKIKGPFQCGLTWEKINQRKPINISKILAYTSLMSSATNVWADISIDECIVVPDFKGEVTGVVDFIEHDYTITRGERTVEINHIDGAGIYISDNLSDISKGIRVNRNKMVRGPYIKGLVSPFEVLRFCREHGVEPVIEDCWGKVHNLIDEGIKVIFSESQFKMHAYYDSWDEYKNEFKKNGCQLRDTNYEADYIKDCEINYQMLQALIEFTDEEIQKFTAKTHQKIEGIAKNKESMLRVLKADEDSEINYRKALALYNELLREGYARETLKNTKKRWTLDAKSGKIVCQNKRLFVIPDLYAACEFWFLHDTHPKGLLQNGEVGCLVYRNREKVDCLRSPSLYFEHAVRRVSKDPKVYDWFQTNGIYTSCHDLISRVLQFDCDGDQLNVVGEPVIIEVAERTRDKYNVVPLFYDANAAPGELVSRETIYEGILRAHNNSGIGAISNNLTILWNKPNPDFIAAALLCYFNNQMIDGAKTGEVNSYESYPEPCKRIKAATGGGRGKMPYFFQFSKNGRRDLSNKMTSNKVKVTKPNNSVMNRICKCFEDIGRINPNFAGIPPFNWQMLMAGNVTEYNEKAIERFCELDSGYDYNTIHNLKNIHESTFLKESNVGFVYETVSRLLDEEFGLENIFPSITKYLFAGSNEQKYSHKKAYWAIFGDIAVRNLERNLQNYTVCEHCGMKIPSWVKKHTCSKNMTGYLECIDCGKIVERINSKQCRCADCQKEYRRITQNRLHAEYNKQKRRKAAG